MTFVRMAKNHSITFRQTQSFLSKLASKKSAEYAHAGQMKRDQKERNKLRTYLGRVSREIKSQLEERLILKNIFEPALEIIDKVLEQMRERNKRSTAFTNRMWNVFQKTNHIKSTNLAAKYP